VVYLTKGSGSNGIDTVYFLDTTGTACPTTLHGGGVGIPAPATSLPSATSFTSPTFSISEPALGLGKKNPGLTPTNLCVLTGFPTNLAKNATNASDYPFGIWFANPTTLYVADEGSGDNTFSPGTNTYTAAASSSTAGLQKWVFDGTAWKLAHTVQNGLNLGMPCSVANDAKGNSYSHRAQHLRGIEGERAEGPLDASHRRAAQPDRPGQRQRYRIAVGHHLDGQLERGPGRGPQRPSCGDRQSVGDHPAAGRELFQSWRRPTAKSCEAFPSPPEQSSGILDRHLPAQGTPCDRRQQGPECRAAWSRIAADSVRVSRRSR
jgi:hypothetical protein